MFSSGESEMSQASVTKHEIRLYNDTPIFQKTRRFPLPTSEKIEKQYELLNAMDMIEPSISPWSSPVVLVGKKNESLRLCIDNRKLNSHHSG